MTSLEPDDVRQAKELLQQELEDIYGQILDEYEEEVTPDDIGTNLAVVNLNTTEDLLTKAFWLKLDEILQVHSEVFE